jgi:hypothetical protein
MFDAGFVGGNNPAAPAGAHINPALMEIMSMTPMGSIVATRRCARYGKVTPLVILFPLVTIAAGKTEFWVDRTKRDLLMT